MERRGFIKISSLAAVGMMTANAHGNALSKLGEQSKLAEPKTHVRHGDYRLEKAVTLFLPNWIRFYKPHVFHENGFGSGVRDLNIIQFELYSNHYSLGFNADKIYLLGNESSKEVPNNSTDVLQIKVGEVLLEVGKSKLLKSHKFENVTLVLEGDVSVNENVLSKHDLAFSSESKINHSNLNNGLLLRISKT